MRCAWRRSRRFSQDKAVDPRFFNAEAQRGRRYAENGFYLAGYAKVLAFLCGPLASPLRLCVGMQFLGLAGTSSFLQGFDELPGILEADDAHTFIFLAFGIEKDDSRWAEQAKTGQKCLVIG